MKLLTKSGKPVQKKYNYTDDYNEAVEAFLEDMYEVDEYFDTEDQCEKDYFEEGSLELN